MSVSQVPLRPIAKGSLIKLWLAVATLIALAYGIAYAGAGQLKNVSVETVAAGTGPMIAEMDGVIIEYTGRKEDGSIFDSTEGRGPLPMLVATTIPGFKEALTQMQQGGRYKVLIPARLAYGENPKPGEPAGDLSFDVHVLQVAPNAALQMGAVPQQGQ